MSEHELRRYRTAIFDSDRWHDFEFRPGDVVISTPSKCGTTWAQMICALLVFQDPVLTRPLSELSPWLDMRSRARREVVADLEGQDHRRFIKTHTPLDGLPLDDSVTYLCLGRDPRDVALSMDNHMANLKLDLLLATGARAAEVGDVVPDPPIPPPARQATERDRFWHWVDDDTPPSDLSSSLLRLLHHLQTFWDAPGQLDVVLLHYDDLLSDLEGRMRFLAKHLEITVPEDRWPPLVEAATFAQMRAQADLVAPNAAFQVWQDNRRFFHRGESGQWRRLLDDGDLDRYRARVAALASPAVVEWVHRGWP